MHDDPDQDRDSGRTQTFPIGVLPLQLARSISLQQMFDLPRITDNGSSTRFPATSQPSSRRSPPAQIVTIPSPIGTSSSQPDTRRPPSPFTVPPAARCDSPQDKPEERTRSVSNPGFETIPGFANNLQKNETPHSERPPIDTTYTFPPVASITTDWLPANGTLFQSSPSQFPRAQTPPRAQDFPNSNDSPPDCSPTEPWYARTPSLRRRRSSIFPPPDEDLARSRATSLAPRGRTSAPRTPKRSAPPTKIYATRSRSAGPMASRPTSGEVESRDPVMERYQREEAVREFGLRKRRREGEDGEGYFLRKGARTVTSTSEVWD